MSPWSPPFLASGESKLEKGILESDVIRDLIYWTTLWRRIGAGVVGLMAFILIVCEYFRLNL
jgi:hypothetical protein